MYDRKLLKLPTANEATAKTSFSGLQIETSPSTTSLVCSFHFHSQPSLVQFYLMLLIKDATFKFLCNR